MITTRFLAPTEYFRYEAWLKKMDSETRATYFGVPQGDYQIEQLVKGVVATPDRHNFLVAEYKGEWIGTIHIAECSIDEVEFGVIVDASHRGNGIADRMLGEAILWARNRGYHSLFMHCLSWNQPIKHLCSKHGMKLHSEHGETDTIMPLTPPDFASITEEMLTRNKNVYRMFLQRVVPFLDEVYG
jgi:RimJ/RimL family protein N-acetyltransferase